MSPMSEAARKAAGERMRKMQADRRAKKQPAQETPVDVADPALQEALAKQPIRSDATYPKTTHADERTSPDGGQERAHPEPVRADGGLKLEHYSNHITIKVDWDTLPMPEAQQFYASLKSEFEKAGKILNARSNAHFEGYTCFMCKKHFNGNPGFTDHSYRDPVTGLSPRVDCCGELCVINYHKLRIDMRTAQNIKQGAEERGEA